VLHRRLAHQGNDPISSGEQSFHQTASDHAGSACDSHGARSTGSWSCYHYLFLSSPRPLPVQATGGMGEPSATQPPWKP
jgi:hypothetical protein